MNPFARGLAWVALLLLAGGGLRRLLRRPAGLDRPAESFLLGVVWTALVGWALAARGDLWTGWRLVALLPALGLFLPARRGEGTAGRSVPLSGPERLFVVLTALFLGLVLLRALQAPMVAWDERAFWAFKAKVLAHEGSFDGAVFHDLDRVHPHRRYPPLIPLFEAWIAGPDGWDDGAVKAFFPLFLGALVLVLYPWLRRRVGRPGALAAVCVFVALPSVGVMKEGGAASGYADLPLGLFLAALALGIREGLEGEGGCALAGAAGVGAALTKNEALAYLVLLGAALLPEALRRRRVGVLAACLAPGLAAGIAWQTYALRFPADDENYPARVGLAFLAAGFPRLPWILWEILQASMDPLRWGVVWSGSVLLALGGARSERSRGLGSFLLWGLLLHLWIYVIGPGDTPGFVRTTVDRLLLHFAPLGLAWGATAIAAPRGERLAPPSGFTGG